MRYKGLIPATFGTETAARFQKFSPIYMKQTAPDHLVRNPKNKPDAYETAAFERFGGSSSASDKRQIISELVDEGRSARLMLPLYYEKSCMACHGEPKGEQDISGYAREGGKEGDLAGAISVMIPLK
jgi:general secretion pathway protein A